MIRVNNGEGDAESLLPVQNRYEVQIGERLSLPPAHRPGIVDGDALLLWKDGLNGLPIRARDKSRDSSQDSRPSKDKAATTQNLN